MEHFNFYATWVFINSRLWARTIVILVLEWVKPFAIRYIIQHFTEKGKFNQNRTAGYCSDLLLHFNSRTVKNALGKLTRGSDFFLPSDNYLLGSIIDSPFGHHFRLENLNFVIIILFYFKHHRKLHHTKFFQALSSQSESNSDWSSALSGPRIGSWLSLSSPSKSGKRQWWWRIWSPRASSRPINVEGTDWDEHLKELNCLTPQLIVQNFLIADKKNKSMPILSSPESLYFLCTVDSAQPSMARNALDPLLCAELDRKKNPNKSQGLNCNANNIIKSNNAEKLPVNEQRFNQKGNKGGRKICKCHFKRSSWNQLLELTRQKNNQPKKARNSEKSNNQNWRNNIGFNNRNNSSNSND